MYMSSTHHQWYEVIVVNFLKFHERKGEGKIMSFQDVENEGRPSTVRAGILSSSQSVAAIIFQINTGVSGFRRLVDSLGTSKDTPDHRRKLHSTRQRIVHLVKETSPMLKSLSESDHSTTNGNASKRIEHAKLAKDFQNILVEFQKVRQLSSERESTCTPFLQPSSSSDNTMATANAEASMEQEKKSFLMEQKRQEVLLVENEIGFNDAIMEEREQGMVEIQYQIGQTNDLFKDLALLVHKQGVIIDDIQSNIEASSGATTQARVQLSKASKSRKAKCSWCRWVLGIVTVVIVIGLVIIIIL